MQNKILTFNLSGVHAGSVKDPGGPALMRPLQLEDAELMTIAIQQEISRSEEARYDHRLHGVLLVGQGLSCLETAQLLGQDPVTVQRWVHRFNQSGFAGLHEGERPPARLPLPRAMGEAGPGPAPRPTRLGLRAKLVGRQAARASSGVAPGRAPGRAPMPAHLRTAGLSPAQAPARDRPRRPPGPSPI